MDPCECAHSQLAMERLLAFLRVAQDQCTDTQCLSPLPNPNAGGSLIDQNDVSDNGFFLMFMGMIFAMMLFALRPQRRDTTREMPTKAPRRDNNDFDSNDGTPPNPPPNAF